MKQTTRPLPCKSFAKAVVGTNAPASSDLSVSDNADNIEAAVEESFFNCRVVHATGATVAQAGEFITT